ncbi:glycosyltransferase [Magnetovibrio sp. PR-2]|uniref:glycosyltransferase n=1 Tax=Magnetovibrio sp. PR-2 TaxID=3120356 RepID=UPI002FCE2EB8
MTDAATYKLTIIVPSYNEADNMLPLFEAIERDVHEQNREIIVVDDDSPDGTAEVVKKAMSEYGNLKLIVRTEDKGLVNSINEGIRAAQGEVIVWLDADLTMPPHHLNHFLGLLDQGADMVVGSRYKEGGGIKGASENGKTSWSVLLRNIQDSEDSIFGIAISKIGNWTVRNLLEPEYFDYTSGFYAVRRSVFDTIEVKGKYLDYCIRFLVQTVRAGFKVEEVPVVMMPRERGESKTTSGAFTLMKIMFDCFIVIMGLVTRRI